MKKPTLAALSEVPLFSALSARELGTIASASHERVVPAGTRLTEQGHPGDEFFIIADGEVAVEVGGREVRRMGPGDFFGEIALVVGGRRTATTTTAKPTRLLVLPARDFNHLLRRQPRIEDKVLATMTERLRFR